MASIKDLIQHYGTRIKRSLLFLNIFFMLIAVQTYVNYTLIIENTDLVDAQRQSVEDEIAYFHNFQLKYLNSDHAKRFLAHENNILAHGEAIITFEAPVELPATDLQPAELQLTPREERKNFFAQRLNS